MLAAEGQLDGRDVDTGQQRVEVGGGEVLRSDAESECIDACVEELERLFVGSLGALHADGLVYMPVVVRARASYIRELSGLGAQEPETFEIFGPVVGTDIESLAGSPYEFALVVSTFQVGLNHLFPLLGRDRREFGEQLFTLGICHNYIRD